MIVPPDPGVLSAHGLLATDLRREFRRTRVVPLADEHLAIIRGTFEEMIGDADRRARDRRRPARATPDPRPRRRPLRGPGLDAPARRPAGGAGCRGARARSARASTSATAPRTATRSPATRSRSSTSRSRPPASSRACPRLRLQPRPRSATVTRPIQFGPEGFVDALVVDRAELGEGDRVDGPAAIEGLDFDRAHPSRLDGDGRWPRQRPARRAGGLGFGSRGGAGGVAPAQRRSGLDFGPGPASSASATPALGGKARNMRALPTRVSVYGWSVAHRLEVVGNPVRGDVPPERLTRHVRRCGSGGQPRCVRR